VQLKRGKSGDGLWGRPRYPGYRRKRGANLWHRLQRDDGGPL